MNDNLLKNVHLTLKAPTANGKTYLVRGDYTFYNYNCCDDLNDVGWGCGYRTLQSICSWIKYRKAATEGNNVKVASVPTLREIQQILVDILDKPQSFLNSREWIGALEVFYVIDTLYDVSCKIQHISKCDDIKKYTNILKHYFEEFGGFVMMGGDIDASSKGIAGIHIAENEAYLLIIDPHFIGNAQSAEDLIRQGFVKWQHTSEFVDSSFYNLCLPQLKNL